MKTPIDIAYEFGGIMGEEYNFDGYKVPEKLGWKWVNGYAVELECAEFLWGLVRYLKPKIVVETGTYYGFGTASMALACKENNLGHVWSIEINDGMAQEAWKHINNLKLQEWCDVVSGDSLSDKLLDCLSGKQIDMLLVDGGDREKEQEKYSMFMSKHGVILQHDALKHDYVYKYATQKNMGFVWGLRGLAIKLPNE